ncbi:phage holin family protein [Candidatus Saccharibacteria bacterium]|nr:phage holin family protein [Candidatus Saccharibacteria bacterium]
MRTLLNFVIDGLILWAASKLSPHTVQIDSFGTLVLATFLLTVIAVIVGLLCILIAEIGMACDNALWLIFGFVALLFSDVIAMAILSNSLGGFNIVGFWPKVLLSFVMFLFELSSPNRD